MSICYNTFIYDAIYYANHNLFAMAIFQANSMACDCKRSQCILGTVIKSLFLFFSEISLPLTFSKQL